MIHHFQRIIQEKRWYHDDSKSRTFVLENEQNMV